MINFLFDRFGWMVRFMEGVGAIGAYLFLQLFHWKEGITFAESLFLLVLVQHIFFRVCDSISWYPNEGRQLGIEVHFKKALVPSSYALALTAWTCLFGFQLPLLILANLVLFFMTMVNIIQIWFHFHDKEDLPVNYFTSNRHLEEELEQTITAFEAS